MATKKYKTFTPVVTTSAVLSTVPNVDGQLVVTKDGGGIYYDDGTNRTLVSKDSTKLSSSGGTLTGNLGLRGTSSGATYLISSNNTTTNNTLTLPSTTGTLLTSENAAGTYLPLTGGTLSGDLGVGSKTKTTQSTMGVQSAAGTFSIYSNPSSGVRGLWDGNLAETIIKVNKDNSIVYRTGTVDDMLYINATSGTGAELGVASDAGRVIVYSDSSNGNKGLKDVEQGISMIWADSNKTIWTRAKLLDGIPVGASTANIDSNPLPFSRTYSRGGSSTAGYAKIATINCNAAWQGSTGFMLLSDSESGNSLCGLFAYFIMRTNSSDTLRYNLRYIGGSNNSFSAWKVFMTKESDSVYHIYLGESTSWGIWSVMFFPTSGRENLTAHGADISWSSSYSGTIITYATKENPSVLSGTSIPSSSTGVNGDVYLVYSS
jgi:hypothetical protein